MSAKWEVQGVFNVTGFVEAASREEAETVFTNTVEDSLNKDETHDFEIEVDKIVDCARW